MRLLNDIMSKGVNFVLARKINTFAVHKVQGTLVLHRPKWNENAHTEPPGDVKIIIISKNDELR